MPFKPPAFIAETIRNNWGETWGDEEGGWSDEDIKHAREAWIEASEADAAAVWDILLERGRINRIPPQFYKDDITWELVLSVERTDEVTVDDATT